MTKRIREEHRLTAIQHECREREERSPGQIEETEQDKFAPASFGRNPVNHVPLVILSPAPFPPHPAAHGLHLVTE